MHVEDGPRQNNILGHKTCLNKGKNVSFPYILGQGFPGHTSAFTLRDTEVREEENKVTEKKKKKTDWGRKEI